MFRDPRGCIVHDRGCVLVGAVRELYCDPETLRPEFAEVALARGLASDEGSLLYPWKDLSWTPRGSLFMNDWIQEALRCRAHAFDRVMHLRVYALETLDQALQRSLAVSL